MSSPSLTEVENTLYLLNYRWSLEALALFRGEKVPFEPYRIYDGYDAFISLDMLSHIDNLAHDTSKIRLRHALIDHYLQRALMPHETEMRAWMNRASAIVNGEKVCFSNIIPWCRRQSSLEKRRILQKETGPLCKFLRPFATNYWGILLDILRDEMGFKDYVSYCHQKKGIDYSYYYGVTKELLKKTNDLYFFAMERWVRQRFNLPLTELNRFDAINLLGLGQFDSFLAGRQLTELTSFFHYWGIDIYNTPGLNLDMGTEDKKSSQAMCFVLQAPEEVYVVIKPEGGWVDFEALWHELGHGLAAVFTSPGLTIVERDMSTSSCLSESFAFLLQNIILSVPFLEEYLNLSREDSKNLFYYKVLRDLSVFRRYAAKFLFEFEMFSSGEIENGESYSELMGHYTGFYYQPESHLFDLTTEFYSLDYILAWFAEAYMEEYLTDRFGSRWMFSPETGDVLRSWWKQGNRYNIFQFMSVSNLHPLDCEALVRRWTRTLI